METFSRESEAFRCPTAWNAASADILRFSVIRAFASAALIARAEGSAASSTTA